MSEKLNECPYCHEMRESWHPSGCKEQPVCVQEHTCEGVPWYHIKATGNDYVVHNGKIYSVNGELGYNLRAGQKMPEALKGAVRWSVDHNEPWHIGNKQEDGLVEYLKKKGVI